MGVVTTYDEMRNDLRNKLDEALKLAVTMTDDTVWGYKDMKPNYIFDVIFAIAKAKETI